MGAEQQMLARKYIGEQFANPSLEQGRVVFKQKELTVNTMIVLLKMNLWALGAELCHKFKLLSRDSLNLELENIIVFQVWKASGA